jgi:signal transduction histidine kinase
MISPATKSATLYTRQNIMIAIVATVIYVVTYLLIAPYVGLPGAFAMPLAGLFGWLFRVRGGLFYSLAVVALTIFLSFLTTGNFGRTAALWLGYLMIVLLSAAIGWLHNYIDQVHDQTQQLTRTEHELRQSNMQLQREIIERIRTEEALAIARDQALEANRFKSQLLSKVSHELRTPLSSILGFAELLNDGTFGDLTAEQKPASEQIISSVHYLNNLVNELLDEAQISSKTIILRPENFSPRDMLKLVEGTMSNIAQQKGLTLTTHTQPNLPQQLIGDQQRLQQILINLVGNAIKFTKTGKIEIEMFCPDTTHWAIRVSDTGVGIPRDAQSYIFDSFRQVNSSLTQENRGTGLGLSITKQLVELMNGEITLTSELGKGSTFTILLPQRLETKR